MSRSSPGSVPRGGATGAILAPGTWLGKHQLLHRLAVGGMAEIYLARATGIEQFEKLLVLKRMLPQHAADHRFIRMFLDEARLAATLSHPNIAHVYDIGGGDGHYYFTMEYVHGEDLAAVLRASRAAGRAVPLAHALTIATGVAAGLHAAHDKRGPGGALLGVVHRDVSPSNIVVGYDGCVKLVDFGIAKIAAQHGRTRTGGFLGKARYSSPEHVQGQPLDRRSDVFALGVVLFELTCGAPPFDGDTDFAVMQAIVHGDAPRPRDRVADYPEALEQIVLRALHRDRDARFATAQELQLALEDFARHHQLALSSVGLSAYLGELFGDKLAAWHDAQRAGHSLTEHVITAMTGGTVDLAALSAAPPPPAAPPGPAAVHRSASRLRRSIGLAVVGVAAALGIAHVVGPAPRAELSGAAAIAPPRESNRIVPEPARSPTASAASVPAVSGSPASVGEQRATEIARSDAAAGPTAAAIADSSPSVDERRPIAPPPPDEHRATLPPTPPARPRGTDGKRSTASPRGHREAAAARPARTRPWDPDSPLEP
ncbi:MAG TPA: protein kinase [Kofleriaceae bacterium]|nr:protein kinase [Kofleriaceae bacterium]